MLDKRPALVDLPKNVLEICHHGLTEMVNNSIDHSEGMHVEATLNAGPEWITLIIQDNGVGIFRKITQHFNLSDERLVLLELSKGKLTTDPDHHSGEGVFFTSRMFGNFRIVSGGLVFDHKDAHPDDDMLLEAEKELEGIAVGMRIACSFANAPPEVELVPVQTTTAVGQMIRRAESARNLPFN